MASVFRCYENGRRPLLSDYDDDKPLICESFTKRFHRIRLLVTVLATGLVGGFNMYHVTVCNNVSLMLKTWINETYYNRASTRLEDHEVDIFWTMLTATVFTGGILGALGVRIVAVRCGRRNGLILCGILSTFGSALAGLSDVCRSFELIFIGRLLVGIPLGLGTGIGAMYVTEVSELNIRGMCGTIVGISFAFGDFLSYILTLPSSWGTKEYWPLAFAFPGILSLLATLVLLTVRESPRHLYITENNLEKAVKSLVFFQGLQTASNSMHDLQLEKNNMGNRERNINFFTFVGNPSNWRRIWLIVALNAVSVLSGCVAVDTFSTEMLYSAEMDKNTAKKYTLSIGALNVLCAVLTGTIIEKLGRRKPLLVALYGCITSMAVMCILTGLITMGEMVYPGLITASGVCLLIFMMCFGIQESIVGFVVAELFDQENRDYAVAFSQVLYFIFSAGEGIIYPSLLYTIGVSYSIIPFVIIPLAGMVYLQKVLPETKGCAVWEVNRDFESIVGDDRSFISYGTFGIRRRQANVYAELQEVSSENEIKSSIPAAGIANIS